MDYFRNGLKSVLGPPPGNQPTGAETVERLVSRVSTSTLLEDRRDACRALKALSKKYRLEVGAQGMDVLRQVLELDRSDCEIVGYCLDTLCNITAKQTFEEEMNNVTNNVQANVGENFTETFVGEQFTEMFLKNPENVNLVLSFMEEYDFRVRWPAVKLMTSLILSKPKVVQDIVLVSPMGVSKLMDLLLENREVIRNDALLLLINLTKSNANIQKIVAFENAFDRLFDVINSEGGTDGGIVVEDCFLLLLNLLRTNTSNIHFFKEGSYIQRLAPMLALPADLEYVGWTPQKASNFHCVLLAVRALVSPGNPAHLVAACQQAMRSTGLLQALAGVLMAAGVPADILTETINTLGEVIRGDGENQEFFDKVEAPSSPPRPAMTVLLMSMVNEKQPLPLRCAVSYCLQCHLHANPAAQDALIATLLPTTTAPPTTTTVDVTAGQLLCGGLLGSNPVASWLAAVALAHCLAGNAPARGRLLRVRVAGGAAAEQLLLERCAALAQQSGQTQARLGALMLLAQWMAQAPRAVEGFLRVPGAVAFLTAQTSGGGEGGEEEELLQGVCAFLLGLCVAFNDDAEPNYSRSNLAQLIEKRVGVETHRRRLAALAHHEAFARAAKRPQPQAKRREDLLLEHEFCRLFRAMEAEVARALGGGGAEVGVSGGEEREDALLAQYKALIRDQDGQIRELRGVGEERERRCEELRAQLEDLQSTNRQLVDHNTLLKAQLAASAAAPERRQESPPDADGDALKARLTLLEGELAAKAAELERLRRDQDDLLELLTDQDLKLNGFKERLRELGENVDDGESDNNSGESENSA